MQDTANAAAAVGAVREFRVDRWFYVAMAICAIVTVVLGFAPSALDAGARKAPLTPLVAAHGAASLAWLVMFLVQTALAATRRFRTHRQLGTAAMLLAPVMIALGYVVAIAMARRGFDLSGDLDIDADPLLGLVNPLGDLVTFGTLAAAGFWFRRQGDVHKRLMLLATVGGLMPAPLAHLIGHSPWLRGMGPIIVVPIAVFLFASAAYDRLALGRVHPVSLWGATLIFVWDLSLNIVIGPSDAWHQFAQRLVR